MFCRTSLRHQQQPVEHDPTEIPELPGEKKVCAFCC